MDKIVSKYYKIISHPDIDLLEIIWTGEVKSDDFRKGTIEMLDVLQNERLSKVIMDMEKISFSVTQEDHEWLKENYVPKAIGSNLKTIAFVEPGFVNTLSIANILYPYFPTAIDFEIFDSFELASKWILHH